jgi:RsiW-degrading membrane proteinase PrsW (M82 family)
VTLPLLLCGLLVGTLVRRETGPDGFTAGLLLALLPVPILLGAFRRLDAATPTPRRALAFAFGWGACVATLLALTTNGLLVRWLTGETATVAPTHADTLELTVIAPVVEETAKAAALWLLFLHRPHAFDGPLAGIVGAGVTATGFAFTENILYLGNAVTRDRASGTTGLWDSTTVLTFVVRVLVAPFAHPVFTALTGLGFGLAAALGPRVGAAGRVALPLLGLAAAMGLHSAWNASTSLSLLGFTAVYGLLMVPAFVGLAALAVWSRQRRLRVVRATLPRYAEAGWLDRDEPETLASLRARSRSRRRARRRHGPAAARATAAYQATATALAVLRDRAERGRAGADFVTREQALLAALWHHRRLARPRSPE